MRNRIYYSTQHLKSGELFADDVADLESQLVSDSASDAVQSRHRASAIAVTFAVVAFLESAINELFQDALDDHLAYIAPLGPAIRESMGSFWRIMSEHSLNNRSRFGTTEKYDTALALCHAEPFDHDSELYTNVRRIIRIQNSLVHYKPNRLMEIDTSGFDEDLHGLFELNRWTNGTEVPFFPDKVLGAGLCRWQIEQAKKYTASFFDEIGVRPNFMDAR